MKYTRKCKKAADPIHGLDPALSPQGLRNYSDPWDSHSTKCTTHICAQWQPPESKPPLKNCAMENSIPRAYTMLRVPKANKMQNWNGCCASWFSAWAHLPPVVEPTIALSGHIAATCVLRHIRKTVTRYVGTTSIHTGNRPGANRLYRNRVMEDSIGDS